MRFRTIGATDPYFFAVTGADAVNIYQVYRKLRAAGVRRDPAREVIHRMFHVGVRSTFRWTNECQAW